MKKKLFVLTLALSIALVFCACGRKDNVSENIQEGQEKLVSVEQCHMVVQLTVGHELELYLNGDGTVLKAAADEEGEAFLAELELAGLSYEDAVGAILSRAEEQGILTGKAHVPINVLASAGGTLTFEQTNRLQQAVTDYDGNFSAFADQSIVVAEDCGAEKVVVDTLANGDLFYDYYVNDVAVRQVCYHTDGSCTEWIYDETGRNTLAVITVTADGLRKEERSSYENGIQTSHSMSHQEGDRFFSETEYYDENGVKTGWAHTTREGDRTVTEEQRYENGQIVYSCMKDSEGASGETSYYSDGTVKMTKESRPDGSVSENHYYPNGKAKSSAEYCPNGENYVYRCTSYEEDGSGWQEDEMKDGTVRRSEFNADGVVILFRCTYPNGDWEERTFYPGGIIQKEESSIGGEYYVNYYDENGQLMDE